jgi:hypothetical protein
MEAPIQTNTVHPTIRCNWSQELYLFTALPEVQGGEKKQLGRVPVIRPQCLAGQHLLCASGGLVQTHHQVNKVFT